MVWLQLIFMLIVIFIAAEVFTNAIEHFGEKIGISEGVTGSIFAAIATALPETMVPVLAIIAGTKNKEMNAEISVGAILGAPLMLSTLAIFLLALFILRRRGITGYIRPEMHGFKRDLDFFLAAFLLATIAIYLPTDPHLYRILTSLLLVLLYCVYLFLTLKASKTLVKDGHGVKASDPMFLVRIGMRDKLSTIILRLIIGLILLIIGAKGFISGVEHISVSLQISALLLSLLIIPIATELPEKINSIIWIRKNKDTMSMGNITGAMVFQGALLPALGIWLTPWQYNPQVLWGMIITFIAALWLRLIHTRDGLRIGMLLLNGLLYFIYLYFAFTL